MMNDLQSAIFELETYNTLTVSYVVREQGNVTVYIVLKDSTYKHWDRLSHQQ